MCLCKYPLRPVFQGELDSGLFFWIGHSLLWNPCRFRQRSAPEESFWSLIILFYYSSLRKSTSPCAHCLIFEDTLTGRGEITWYLCKELRRITALCRRGYIFKEKKHYLFLNFLSQLLFFFIVSLKVYIHIIFVCV